MIKTVFNNSYSISNHFLFMSLRTKFLGFDVKNPLMPAPGPPVRDAKACIECIKGGCGVMVTKTISTKAAKVPTPNMYESKVHKYFLNTELWTELAPEKWLKYEYPKIREACDQAKIPMICSMGYTAEEISEMAPKVAPFADAVELSTHYIGDDPKPMQDAIRAAIEGTGGKPVIVKLSPFRDAGKAAKAAKEAGAAAITCVNSFGPCIAVDIERGGAPFMGSDTKYGWVSGPALKPLAQRVVFDVAREVDIPVIGVGGITCGTDAIEYLMCGASALGICTSAIVKGRDIFGLVAKEMSDWLNKHDYKSFEEIIGLSIHHKGVKQYKSPKIDVDKCVGCGTCVTSCLYGALTLCDEGYVKCDNMKCFRCGLCYSRCPTRAITIQG
ncbi:dihydroorotate dehydrogenase family protein [Tritrichomonas foetus]|uniref:Dihydrothymine dehydrogenase n=1 Tax=Tritrichomonas foetus TaxID=1144522 RepID=A0A1J4JPX3_9EUKA|nr:dihydroorotate dehydrogenase family protein [Tritrichomonas foetus]|eukprot:OHT01091.1 dihydroorotate dehydrogenase family protein [Tritrichomonas foetus]